MYFILEIIIIIIIILIFISSVNIILEVFTRQVCILFDFSLFYISWLAQKSDNQQLITILSNIEVYFFFLLEFK